MPLRGQLVPRRADTCAWLGGNGHDGASLIRLVAPKTRTVVAHKLTDFINDRVKDLLGRHAPREKRGDATKRGLLGLDPRESRSTISDVRRHPKRL